ncbi:GntR family transcriptional regulator [Oscillospiraceae bacterium]|nr:GntR family transcriptional regulator [Oscillospiraceae bacterium]BDF76459.1 GntR family transcriptional regulator [Oscillospiraceae bacterium]
MEKIGGNESNQKKRVKRSDIVAQKLMEAIASGQFETGSRLPSESVLAEQFGVSRATLREAFKKLEQLGTIKAKQGSGTYVLYDPSRPGGVEAAAPAPVSLETMVNKLFTVNHFQVTQYLDARTVVEVAALELAVVCMDNENFLNLSKILLDSGEPDCALEDYINYDCMFHRELVRASKNDFLYQFWLILEPCLREQLSRVMDRNLFIASREKHRLIFDALLRRDKKEAISLLEEHFSTILGRFFVKATQLSKSSQHGGQTGEE